MKRTSKKQNTPYWPLLLAFFLASAIGLTSHFSVSAQRSTNPIVKENQKKGSTSWQSEAIKNVVPLPQEKEILTQRTSGTEPQVLAVTSTIVEGYPGKTSINHGETLNFHIRSTAPTFNIEFYRIGWYGGAGATLVSSGVVQPGQDYPVPTPDPTTGLVDAGWPVSYTLQTTTSWVTGAYFAKLIAPDNTVGYIPFVVRDDSSTADILYQMPVTTEQAYNNWGGKSLYDYNSTNSQPARKVSFNRPYAGAAGAAYLFNTQYGMIRFLEKNGYNMAYATNIDTHTNPNLMDNHKVFVSNFHDEYWTWEMRENITAVRDAGKDLAFFDSNNVYWQVRFEPATDGTPNRTMVGYKIASLDPMSTSSTPHLTTVKFRSPPVNKPENELLGVMYENSWSNWNQTYPWVVSNASHWVYEGTGLVNGNQIPGVVGYEYDNVNNNGLTPTNLEVLSNSPVLTGKFSNGAIYQKGEALVFTAGTNFWSFKVDQHQYNTQSANDVRIQTMTKNILNRMITNVPSTPTPTPAPTVPPTATPVPTASPTPAPSTGPGTGLRGNYFDNADLTNLKLTRTDGPVSFNWGANSPNASKINAETFSVRWTGFVKPLYSQTYTFYTWNVNDGVRLWVNNQLLVDDWVTRSTAGPEKSGTISLVAGVLYPITIEYFDNTGNASISLRWSSASQAKTNVPKVNLYPQ